jgi:hypothetical protein
MHFPLPPLRFVMTVGVTGVGTIRQWINDADLGAKFRDGFIQVQGHLYIIVYDVGGILCHIMKTAYVRGKIEDSIGALVVKTIPDKPKVP